VRCPSRAETGAPGKVRDLPIARLMDGKLADDSGRDLYIDMNAPTKTRTMTGARKRHTTFAVGNGRPKKIVLRVLSTMSTTATNTATMTQRTEELGIIGCLLTAILRVRVDIYIAGDVSWYSHTTKPEVSETTLFNLRHAKAADHSPF
jgi:hypothetical protein